LHAQLTMKSFARTFVAAWTKLAPFHLHDDKLPRDLNHSWHAARAAMNGGKMDGFLWGGVDGGFA
jgi:phospholipase C